jgi:hypothetical protein
VHSPPTLLVDHRILTQLAVHSTQPPIALSWSQPTFSHQRLPFETISGFTSIYSTDNALPSVQSHPLHLEASHILNHQVCLQLAAYSF